MLADGSEYRGDYDPGDAALRDVHAPRIEALLDAGVDLLAFETIPTVREAEVLVELLDESGATAWLSYSCRDGSSTSAGEPVGGLRSRWATIRGSSPSASTAPRRATCRPCWLRPRDRPPDMPLIAYPNRGDRGTPPPGAGSRDDGGRFDPARSRRGRLGARWLGGCCGTGPAEIAALADRERRRGTPEPGRTNADAPPATSAFESWDSG